ncbi:MAG: methyltransferase domain-containing protein, partial [Candidatus Altiarchaeota archaeon]
KERREPFEISLKELGERLAFDVHKEIEAIRDKDRKEFPRATPRLISIIQIGVGKGRSLNELSEISDEYVEILGIGARRSEEWKTKTVERSYMHYPRGNWQEPYEVKYTEYLLNWKVASIRKLIKKVSHSHYDFVLADLSDYPASLINEILNTLHVIAKPHAKIVVALSENALKAIKVDSEKIRLIRQISSGEGIIALHFENSNRADYRNSAARIYKGVRNNFGRKHGQIYEYIATPLSEVQERLGFNLLEELNSLINDAEKTGREKPKILDVGAGNGVAIIQLAEKSNYRAEYYALDIKRWPGWTNTKIHWKIGPMEELSRLYKDIKFDLIYSHFGIYNSIDIEKTIQETYKILNYGGTLVTNLKLSGSIFSEKISEIKELLGPFAEEAEIEYKQVNGRDIITIKKPYENLKNSFSAIYQNEFKDEQLSTKKLEIKLKHKERQIAELNEKLREISNIRRTKHDTLIPRQKRSLQRSIGKLKEEINEIKLKILEIKTSEVIASHEEVNYNEIIHKSAKFVNFNELHTDISPKREIAMSMALFRELGFTDIAMEIFRKDANTQKLLDVYFAEENPNKINEYEFEILRKIYEKLDARWLKENPSLAYEYLAVVKAAKENGIMIRAIDVPAGYENLDRDKFMADTIIEILQEDESRRVLGLTGYAHGHEKSYYFYPDFEFGERASSFRISMRTLLNKRGIESVYIDIMENEPKLNIPTNALGLGELYAPSSYYRYLLYQAVLKAKLQNKRFMINMINFPELNLQWVVFSPREFVERLTFQYVPKIEKLEGTGFNSFSSIHKEDDKERIFETPDGTKVSEKNYQDEEETPKERTKRLREIAKYYYQSLLKTHTVVPIGSVFHGGRARDSLAIFEYPGSTKKESDIDIITISYEDAKTERVDITDATGVEITIIKFPFSEFYKIFSPKVGYITELPLAINPIFIQGKNSDLVKKILEEANIQNTKIALERYLYEKNSREVRPIDLTDIIMRKLMPLSFRIISPESYSRVNFIRQISNNVENALENGNLAKRIGNKPEKFTSLSKFIINENIKPKPHRFQQLKSDYNLFFGRGWFWDGRALKIIRIAFKLNKKFYWIKIPFKISKKFAIYGIKIIKSKFTKFKKEFKNRIKTKKAQQINRGLEISQESIEIDYHPRKNSLTLYFNVENVGESTIKKFSAEISFSGTKYSTIIEIENINLKRGQFAFINIEIEDEFLIKRFRGGDFISGSIKIVCFEDKYGKVEDANEQSFTRFPESI